MKRSLQTLAVALAALLAASSLAASVAQAEFPAQLTSEFNPAVLDGTQTGVNTVLTRSGRTVECENVTYSASASSGATEISVTPTFTNCTSNLGPATITTNGCHYVYHLTADAGDTYTGIADVRCPSGAKAEIHIYTSAANHAAGASVCTYHFGETGNQGLDKLDLTNERGSPDWIRVHIRIAHLHSTRTSGSPLICGVENDTEGTLVGEAELRGTSASEGNNGITISTD